MHGPHLSGQLLSHHTKVYNPDSSGRDSYVFRDPLVLHGRHGADTHLHKPVQQLTRTLTSPSNSGSFSASKANTASPFLSTTAATYTAPSTHTGSRSTPVAAFTLATAERLSRPHRLEPIDPRHSSASPSPSPSPSAPSAPSPSPPHHPHSPERSRGPIVLHSHLMPPAPHDPTPPLPKDRLHDTFHRLYPQSNSSQSNSNSSQANSSQSQSHSKSQAQTPSATAKSVDSSEQTRVFQPPHRFQHSPSKHREPFACVQMPR
eukprot:TRINITY_DN2693_c0_g1_i1.p1 TRINITY_DN2693_c0_g1~~TRINITY_DN2693_c0_g1_i1.p1  ORF type:complete len:306 (+),score=59.25 TRINITY_DN2693_c0_g1_i1:138-920(+)